MRTMRSLHVSFALLGTLSLSLTGCPADRPAQAGDQTETNQRLVATQRIEPRAHDRTLPRKLGVLEAAERRQLAFEVSGRLVDVLEEGTRVEADQVIAKLDDTLELAELRRADAMLADARAESKRVQGLSKANAATGKQVDTAQTQLSMRDSEMTMARHRLRQRSLRAGIQGIVADVVAEPGELVLPQAPVATVLDTSSLKLVVGVPGYQVSQVRVGNRARVYVPAAMSEPLIGWVERVAAAALPGEHLFEVEIRLPNPEISVAMSAIPDVPASFDDGAIGPDPGSLPGPRAGSEIASEGAPRDSVEPTSAPTPGDGPAPDPMLRPGMNAWAELIAESFERALVLPLQAMVEHAGERVVFFVEDGRAVPVSVAAARISDEVLILPGDLPYRELIVRGQHDVRPGDPVRVDNRVLREGRAS